MRNWLAGRRFPGKERLKALIGEGRLGSIDYFLDPTLRKSYGGPFNGQHFRQKMVAEIFRALKPSFVVETGTFRGTTTEYLAQLTAAPIHSVEFEARFYGYSRARLRRHPNVHLHRGESSEVLRTLFRDKIIRGPLAFFYLDAHWRETLPLADELNSIFGSDISALVLIDDFQVPDDAGYAFDDYGPGKTLTLSFLASLRTIHRFDIWFPTCRSTSETGSRRGCTLLTRGKDLAELSTLTSIRPWNSSSLECATE